MDTPTIKIDGKVYKAKPPKVKLWRKIVGFNKQFGAVEDMHKNLEAYEAMLDLIAECFGNPEITTEAIEDNLELGELVPTLESVTGWVAELISKHSQELPEKN